jgi:hypothetical protein
VSHVLPGSGSSRSKPSPAPLDPAYVNPVAQHTRQCRHQIGSGHARVLRLQALSQREARRERHTDRLRCSEHAREQMAHHPAPSRAGLEGPWRRSPGAGCPVEGSSGFETMRTSSCLQPLAVQTACLIAQDARARMQRSQVRGLCRLGAPQGGYSVCGLARSRDISHSATARLMPQPAAMNSALASSP